MNAIKYAKGILTAVALGSAVALIGCTQETPNRTPRLTQSPVPTLASQFFSPSSKIPVVLNSNDAGDLDEKIRHGLPQVYENYKKMGLPSLPDGVSALNVVSLDTEYILADDATLEARIITAQKAIAHMSTYLSGVVALPHAEFVIATSPSEVSESLKLKPVTEDTLKVKIYGVQDFHEIVTVQGQALYGDKVSVFTMGPTDVSTEYGKFKARVDILNGKPVFLLSEILWNLDAPEQAILETPALEVLHYALDVFAREHIRQAIAAGEPADGGIVARNSLLEEYVVHGIGIAWFVQLSKDWHLGYDEASIRLDERSSNWWRDENVEKMEGLVTRKGPGYVIGLYESNPQQLISEAGIVLKQ